MNDDERTCPECAETIKKAANVCKHCGHRFRGSKPKNGPRNEAEERVSKNSKIGCAVIVVGLIAMVSFCTPGVSDNVPSSSTDTSSTSNNDEASEENPFDDVAKQGLWIVKSKEGIKKRLKDPGSAKFRDVRFYSGGKTPVVCGQVNAKNALGGYSGFERFIASGDNEDIAFLASDVEAGDTIDTAWKALCIKSPRDEAFVP